MEPASATGPRRLVFRPPEGRPSQGRQDFCDRDGRLPHRGIRVGARLPTRTTGPRSSTPPPSRSGSGWKNSTSSSKSWAPSGLRWACSCHDVPFSHDPQAPGEAPIKRIMTLVLFVTGGSLVFAQNEGKKDEGKKGRRAPSPPIRMRGTEGWGDAGEGDRSPPGNERQGRQDSRARSTARKMARPGARERHRIELEDHWGGARCEVEDDA